jgi:hypothetical protein
MTAKNQKNSHLREKLIQIQHIFKNILKIFFLTCKRKNTNISVPIFVDRTGHDNTGFEWCVGE